MIQPNTIKACNFFIVLATLLGMTILELETMIIFSAVTLLILSIINLIGGIISLRSKKLNHLATTFFISMGLILLVGFPLCFFIGLTVS